MKQRLLFIIPMILAVFTTSLNAIPPYTINRFTESNGQPQDLVTCVTQDTKGYIWISSWNRLSRYDGYTFAHFKARQGQCPMSTNRILYIRETQLADNPMQMPRWILPFQTKREEVCGTEKQKKRQRRQVHGFKEAEDHCLIARIQGHSVWILYHDKQGGYWIYTHKGLDRILFTRLRK